jgi:hypothetical protein
VENGRAQIQGFRHSGVVYDSDVFHRVSTGALGFLVLLILLSRFCFQVFSVPDFYEPGLI